MLGSLDIEILEPDVPWNENYKNKTECKVDNQGKVADLFEATVPWPPHQNTTHYLFQGVRDPFLESPGSFSGPKSNIQIEI